MWIIQHRWENTFRQKYDWDTRVRSRVVFRINIRQLTFSFHYHYVIRVPLTASRLRYRSNDQRGEREKEREGGRKRVEQKRQEIGSYNLVETSWNAVRLRLVGPRVFRRATRSFTYINMCSFSDSISSDVPLRTLKNKCARTPETNEKKMHRLSSARYIHASGYYCMRRIFI